VNPRICKKSNRPHNAYSIKKWFKEKGDISLQIVQQVSVPLISYIYFMYTLSVYNGIGRGAPANPLPKSPRGSQGSSRRIEMCVLY
jgi:hypothetical protein